MGVNMVGDRRLIFHFYANKEWKTNPAYLIHKYFLRKYACIFDDAVFVISVDDVNDWELIRTVECFLIDCNFPSIKFVVEKNTMLYEVETFNKYVIQQIDKLDGLTFFAHSKGTLDYNNPKMNKDAVLIWIASLYYLSLEFYKEAEWGAYTAGSCFFGGPLVKHGENSGINSSKNGFMYSGTFYWLNCKEIYDKFFGNFPEIKNRYYAENFPGNLCRPYNYEAYSHNYMMINRDKCGVNITDSKEAAFNYIKCLLKENGEIEAFLNVYNDLKEYLQNNGVNY